MKRKEKEINELYKILTVHVILFFLIEVFHIFHSMFVAEYWKMKDFL